MGLVALLAEGVDRNNRVVKNGREQFVSPSSRRAWIEIRMRRPNGKGSWVALLAEGVDRNKDLLAQDAKNVVALLAEGVDRNRPPAGGVLCPRVALLAEGVDRNRPGFAG